MGITNMQGTSAYIEYIGERKVKKYSCRNCFNYIDGVCKIKNIAVDYSNGNGKLCSSFDVIDNFENAKYKAKVTKRHKTKTIENINNRNTNNIIINAQKNRKRITNKKVVGNKSEVHLCAINDNNKRMNIKMNDKDLDINLFNRLLDKRILSTILYRDIIYRVTNIIN